MRTYSTTRKGKVRNKTEHLLEQGSLNDERFI